MAKSMLAELEQLAKKVIACEESLDAQIASDPNDPELASIAAVYVEPSALAHKVIQFVALWKKTPMENA